VPGAAGSFVVAPVLVGADGSARPLCEVGVDLAAGDSAEEVLSRARDAINASTPCAAAGVSAALRGLPRADEGGSEDAPARGPKLLLAAPEATGVQLLPSVRRAPGQVMGVRFQLEDVGVAIQSTSVPLTLAFDTLATGARGGTIAVAESSPLGLCSVVVPTLPGQTAREIAASLAQAFQSDGSAGSNCPARENPRDVFLDGASVSTVIASELLVVIDDPGVGLKLEPAEPSEPPPPPSGQLPGDCNQDGALDISDGVCLFGFLFLGSPRRLPCGTGSLDDRANVDLVDWQPDRKVDISDGIALLQFLFAGGPPHALVVPGAGTAGCVPIAGCPGGPRCR
jgi:hypothetical protein